MRVGFTHLLSRRRSVFTANGVCRLFSVTIAERIKVAQGFSKFGRVFGDPHNLVFGRLGDG